MESSDCWLKVGLQAIVKATLCFFLTCLKAMAVKLAKPEVSCATCCAIDPFTERKASWVIGAKFVCSNACFKKLFHASHLGVPSNSASYSLKISSKLMETTQHLPETQDFEILIAFSAWTVLNLCASFTNCALLRVSYSITSLYW